MDQIKTGRFIAELRRGKGLTQEQLGEMLGVTNKTVSRWENGNYMPDIETLQLLASLFHVTINELLSGQRLDSESFPAAAEENLTECLRQSSFTRAEHSSFWKKKWKKEHISEFVLCGLLSLAVVFLFISLLPQWTVLFLALLPLTAAVEYGFFNNRMMAYVEERVFDGTTEYSVSEENGGKTRKSVGPILSRIGLFIICIGLGLNGFELLSVTVFRIIILTGVIFQAAALALILKSDNS